VKLIPSLLAAGWVYIAVKIAQNTGELLPHRFTFSHLYPRVGSLLSVALSLRLP